MGLARLLLVEFYFPDRYSQLRSLNFPFLLGQAARMDVAVRWLCCWAPADGDSRSRAVIDLGDVETRNLIAAMRDFAPTHVILAEKLSDPLARAVAGAFPDAAIENLSGRPPEDLVAWPAGWLPAWLALQERWTPGSRSAWLADAVQPAYECTAVNRRAGTSDPPVYVTVGVDCLYRRKLAGNRFFAGVELPDGVRRFGCSFCLGPADLRYVFDTGPVELAVRQCKAALTAVDSCIAKDRYVVSGARVFLEIDRFLDAILEHPFPPSRFFFACRVDEFLRMSQRIEAVLPRIARAGHSMNVFNMGVENFSPDENERLNKGLAAEQIEEVDLVLRRLERDHAGTFRFRPWGGYGLVLFTPWTTVEDLEINIRHLRRFAGIDPGGFALTSKLQIMTESAIRFAAERDGLVQDTFDGFHAYDSGCVFRHDQREVPWRFQHPEVGALYRIACRISPITAFPEDEALRAGVRELAAVVGRRGGTPFDLFDLALQAVKEPGGAVSADEILARIRRRLAAAAETAPSEAGDRVPGEGTETRSAAVGRAEEILAALARDPGGHLGGLQPDRIWEKTDPEGVAQLVIELGGSGERLTLRLLARLPGAPAFLQTRRFLLRYDEDTPVDTAEKQRAARAIAAHMERYGLRPGTRRGGKMGRSVVPLGAGDVSRLVGGPERKEERT